MTAAHDHHQLLRAKLTLDTAQLPWKELLRYFAAGSVIAVGNGLDLVEVAARISEDDKDAVAQWLAQGRIAKVSDAQAAAWLQADAALWTVVVRPWILVQQDRAA